jgi:DNA replication ATP-dependent helicase Dna2
VGRGQGKSVLLTAYTHSAVDNILLKLLEAYGQGRPLVPFVRLGNTDRVHPSVRAHTDTAQPAVSVAALAQLYEARPVVATTCLGITQCGPWR